MFSYCSLKVQEGEQNQSEYGVGFEIRVHWTVETHNLNEFIKTFMDWSIIINVFFGYIHVTTLTLTQCSNNS